MGWLDAVFNLYLSCFILFYLESFKDKIILDCLSKPNYGMEVIWKDHQSFDPFNAILERYSDALSYNRLKMRCLKSKDLVLSMFKTSDPFSDLFDRIMGGKSF